MAVVWKKMGTKSEHNSAVTASMVVTLPSLFDPGDLLVLFHTQNANTSPEAPPGWTRLGSAQAGSGLAHTSVYWRVADGSEGVSVTLTTSTASFPTGSGKNVAVAMTFSASDASVPFDAAEWGTSSTTANTNGQKSRNHPQVNPAVAGSALVLFRGVIVSAERAFTSTITNSGGSERYDSAVYTGGGPDMAVYTLDGGFTGNQSYSTTINSTTSGGSTEWSMLIRPPAVTTKNSVGILHG